MDSKDKFFLLSAGVFVFKEQENMQIIWVYEVSLLRSMKTLCETERVLTRDMVSRHLVPVLLVSEG